MSDNGCVIKQARAIFSCAVVVSVACTTLRVLFGRLRHTFQIANRSGINTEVGQLHAYDKTVTKLLVAQHFKSVHLNLQGDMQCAVRLCMFVVCC